MPAETSPPNGADTPVSAGDDESALLPRLRVIEDQPLETRAAAFVQIHDRLQGTLEGSVRDGGVDTSTTHG